MKRVFNFDHFFLSFSFSIDNFVTADMTFSGPETGNKFAEGPYPLGGPGGPEGEFFISFQLKIEVDSYAVSTVVMELRGPRILKPKL